MNDEINEINPGIRPFLIALINDFLSRDITQVLIEPGQENPFETMRNKLENKAPISMNAFYTSINFIFSRAKRKENQTIQCAARYLKRKFKKRFEYINKLNMYQFKDLLYDECKNAFPDFDVVTSIKTKPKKEPEVKNMAKGTFNYCSKKPSAKASSIIQQKANRIKEEENNETRNNGGNTINKEQNDTTINTTEPQFDNMQSKIEDHSDIVQTNQTESDDKIIPEK